MSSQFNHLIPQYLVHSLLYYILEDSVLDDAVFDRMCATILAHWDEIDHPHKTFVSRADMQAGTGFALAFRNLPQVVWVLAHKFNERDSFLMAGLSTPDPCLVT